LQDGSVTSQRITNASVIQTFTFGSLIVAPTPDANDDVYQVSPAGTAEHCRSTCISVARTALLFSRSPVIISLLSCCHAHFVPQTNEFFRQTWTRYVQISQPVNFINCECHSVGRLPVCRVFHSSYPLKFGT
jgi:hypothetical protein